MQDELEDYVRNYCIGPGDTERRQESISRHATAVQQMKTVRYSSMAPARRQTPVARVCQSQNFTVKANDQSRQSVCTHLNINEIRKESGEGISIQEEPQTDPKLESLIFGGSEPVGESTISLPVPVAVQKPIPKPVRKVVPRWKGRLLEGILLLMSIGVVFLFPCLYSFTRSIFIAEESYRLTYRPPLPQQVKLAAPLTAISACYLILVLVYLVRKYLHRPSKLRQSHMYIAVGVHTLLQIITIFLWIDGLKLSEQVYQRFLYDPNYETHAVVVLLLRWRVVWLSNITAFSINVVGLVLNLILTRCQKK